MNMLHSYIHFSTFYVFSDYDDSTEEEEEDDSDDDRGAVRETKIKKTGTKIDIDLGLSAFANATRYQKAFI